MTTIPRLTIIYNNILADLQAEFGITFISPSFLKAFAGVLAGMLWLIYLGIGGVQKNIWFDTADSVANGGTLERFGVSILGRYPFAATQAQYSIAVTGSVGGVIPATQVWKSDDSSSNPGMLFQKVGGSYTLTSTGALVTVIALAGGYSSRLVVGNTLTATSPMANVNSSAIVSVELAIPTDAETLEAYRTAITEQVQLKSGSWSAAEYRIVGTTIAGIKQTYAYLNLSNSNEIDVYLQGTVAGVPIGGSIITSYATAIDLVRPIGTFLVNTYASAVNPVDVTITMGGFAPFTTSQKALITTALTNFINSVTPFIASCDIISKRNDVVATFNLNSAITSAVPGYGYSGVTFQVSSVTYLSWMADNGQVPYFNTVTFI
jgi:Baseplate J-like protein